MVKKWFSVVHVYLFDPECKSFKFQRKPRILPQQTIVENEKIYDLTSNPIAHIYQLNISNFWTVYSIFNRSPPLVRYIQKNLSDVQKEFSCTIKDTV